MEIIVDRKWKKADYTIGRLIIDDEIICNTLEDADRGLSDDMPEWMIKNKKIPTRTAVPSGRYRVTLDTVSPRFSTYAFYKEVCKGKLPRILDVKGFDGILIHCGSDHSHTDGCILVGLNKIKGGLTDGKETFKKLYAMMKKAHDKGEEIYITID